MTVGCFVGSCVHRNGSTPRQGGFLWPCKTDSVLKNNPALLHSTTPVSTTWQGAGAGRKWILQPVTNPKMCKEGLSAAKCSTSFWGWTVRPWQKPGSLKQFLLARKVQQPIQPHSLVAPTPPSQDPMVPPPAAWDHPSIPYHLCHSWQVAGARRDAGIKCTKAVRRAASANKGHERDKRAPIFPCRSAVHLPRLKCICFSLPSVGLLLDRASFCRSGLSGMKSPSPITSPVPLHFSLLLWVHNPLGHIIWMPTTHRSVVWWFTIELWVI